MRAYALPSLNSVLGLCADGWAHRFGAALATGWDAVEVADLHDEACRLAIDAEAAGCKRLAEAASEITAYLCSFADEPREPTAAQYARLLHLSRALAAAAANGAAPAPRALELVGDDRFDEID